MNVSEKLGPCTTETPSGSLPLGRPIQSAASTPVQDTRSCGAGVHPVPPQEVICPKSTSASQDSR